MTTQPMDTSQANDPVDEKPNPNAELREYAERVKAENAALRQQVVQGHLTSIGLEVDKGLGKAIVKEYSGEFTAEAIAKYASEEYGYEPQASSEAAATQLQQQQERVDAIQGESAPVTPTGLRDKIAEHDRTLATPEATRADAQAALSDKLDQYLQDFR